MTRKLPANERGKIKIRFFEVELEGGDETLLEGIRTAAAIASRGATSVKVIKALPSTPDAPSAEIVGEREIEPQDSDEAEETERPATGRPQIKKNRSYPTPEVLDIDLKSDLSLESYVAKAKPADDNKKYLVVAAWFKEHRNTASIGINHIWTTFRSLNWGVQKDMGQPFRSLKRQGCFKAADERGQFVITHIGLDIVQKMISGS